MHYLGLKTDLFMQIGGGGDYAPLVENGAILETLRSTATSKVIRDLPTGQVYRFRVAAINKVGKGPDSVPSRAVKTKPTSGNYLFSMCDLFRIY